MQLNTTLPVLVVAPDEGLRRSIAFALEVEGLLVVLAESFPALAEESDTKTIGCAVVDEGAVTKLSDGWRTLMDLSVPIILLSDSAKSIPAAFAGSILRKPLLGGPLIEAVARAVGPRMPAR
jgi:hypothetical protein